MVKRSIFRSDLNELLVPLQSLLIVNIDRSIKTRNGPGIRFGPDQSVRHSSDFTRSSGTKKPCLIRYQYRLFALFNSFLLPISRTTHKPILLVFFEFH